METRTYYQPELIMSNDVPVELSSFMVFPTPEDCRTWMDKHEYLEGEYRLVVYHGDDIEEPTFINGDGECLSAVETEECLDEAYNRILREVKGHFVGGSNGHEPIKIQPTILWETLGELYGIHGPGADKRLVAVELSEDFITCEGGFDIPYSMIEDEDSLDSLATALSFAKAEVHTSAPNPKPMDVVEVVTNAMLLMPEGEELGICAEDEEGELANLAHVWFDKERGMVRLSVQGVRFAEYLEEN